MCKRKTTEDFIRRAREIHGNKYDYSKVEYVNNRTNVTIICPIHGEFKQSPDHHINAKRGCIRCSRKEIATTEEFVEKAISKYGDKYDYSETNYTLPSVPVIIKCNKCGNKFSEFALAHLAGAGCEHCKPKRGKKSLTLEEFLLKANKAHNNKYDYSLVTDETYCGYRKTVPIICPKHGVFHQTPKSHVSGQGCKSCKQSNLEKEVEKFLLENEINFIYFKNDFEWLKMDDNNKSQSLDFYLPDYNVAIECQGEQHFYAIDFAGKGEEWATEQLHRVQELDLRKRILCEENGVRLLYYSHVVADNTINDLNKLLDEIKDSL